MSHGERDRPLCVVVFGLYDVVLVLSWGQRPDPAGEIRALTLFNTTDCFLHLPPRILGSRSLHRGSLGSRSGLPAGRLRVRGVRS